MEASSSSRDSIAGQLDFALVLREQEDLTARHPEAGSVPV
jgi:hypothetical protein